MSIEPPLVWVVPGPAGVCKGEDDLTIEDALLIGENLSMEMWYIVKTPYDPNSRRIAIDGLDRFEKMFRHVLTRR